MSAAAEHDRALVYRLGGIVALVALGGMVLDIVLTMLPGWGPDTVPADAAGWLAQLTSQPLLGLRNLDLLNLTVSVISLLLYVALFVALWPDAPGLALLGTLLVAIGTAAFAGANAALPMLELAGRHVAASPTARAALETSAAALLARGAHGSMGAFPGFFLSAAGTLVLTLAMLRSGVFSRRIGVIGAIGSGLLLVYTVAYTFSAGESVLIMAIAAPGGLLMIAWYAMVGRRLLGFGSRQQDASVALVRQ